MKRNRNCVKIKQNYQFFFWFVCFKCGAFLWHLPASKDRKIPNPSIGTVGKKLYM